MNFKKIAVTAVSMAAAAALTVSASANALKVVDGVPDYITSNNNMWMAKIYVPGQGIDFGMDPRELGKIVFTITPTEPDDFEGQIGGSVILSSGPQNGAPADHNWPQANFWGVYDEEHEIYGRDPEDTTNPLTVENTDTEYVYTLTLNVDDTNNVQQESYDSADCYVQIALQDWSNEVFSEVEVISLELFDKTGALMGKFDGQGNFTAGTAASSAPAAEAAETDAAEPETASDTAAAAETVTGTATAGDTTAATTSSKGSPDTGIADVAAIAGIAVVAGGAVVLSRKRK